MLYDTFSTCRFVIGVILRERIPAFERRLWRVYHGNVFLNDTIQWLFNNLTYRR